MAPNIHNDSSFLEAKDFGCKNAYSVNAESSEDPGAELARLQEVKKTLKDMSNRLPELVAHKYPELAIARAVHKEARDRYTQETRLRRKLGLRIMTDKAYTMIKQELDDRISTYRDIKILIKKNKSAIVAAKYQLEMSSRKRPSEESFGNEAKKSRFD